jgi:putative ABC transport system permease protein
MLRKKWSSLTAMCRASCRALPPYQQNAVASSAIIMRAANPAIAVASLRHVVSRIDATEPIYNLQSMADAPRIARGAWQFQAWFAALGAGTALLLAALDVYGMASHTLQQRTKEIGIRVALGGQPPKIVLTMVKESMRAIALGAIAGIFAAAIVMRSLTSLLYHVRPLDGRTLAGSLFVLATVGLLASYIPARRVARVDPMATLRHE